MIFSNRVRLVFVDPYNDVDNTWLLFEKPWYRIDLCKQVTKVAVLLADLFNVRVQVPCIKRVVGLQPEASEEVCRGEFLVANNLYVANFILKTFLNCVNEFRFGIDAMDQFIIRDDMELIIMYLHVFRDLYIKEPKTVVVLLEGRNVVRNGRIVVFPAEQREATE